MMQTAKTSTASSALTSFSTDNFPLLTPSVSRQFPETIASFVNSLATPSILPSLPQNTISFTDHALLGADILSIHVVMIVFAILLFCQPTLIRTTSKPITRNRGKDIPTTKRSTQSLWTRMFDSILGGSTQNESSIFFWIITGVISAGWSLIVCGVVGVSSLKESPDTIIFISVSTFLYCTAMNRWWTLIMMSTPTSAQLSLWPKIKFYNIYIPALLWIYVAIQATSVRVLNMQSSAPAVTTAATTSSAQQQIGLQSFSLNINANNRYNTDIYGDPQYVNNDSNDDQENIRNNGRELNNLYPRPIQDEPTQTEATTLGMYIFTARQLWHFLLLLSGFDLLLAVSLQCGTWVHSVMRRFTD